MIYYRKRTKMVRGNKKLPVLRAFVARLQSHYIALSLLNNEKPVKLQCISEIDPAILAQNNSR